MQEKESIMVVRCELKIPTARDNSVTLVTEFSIRSSQPLKILNDPKFSDRYAWANSTDPDQSDQGLHYLPFRLHRLDSLLYGRAV